ncbi:MAG TPA: GNAT family N-acetyltransferase [Anaerolineales bacterium]
MIKSLSTLKGDVIIREVSLADVEKFRELRLHALKESPTAFSADYELNASYPASFWKGRLKPDHYGVIMVAEHEEQLIGMTGIRRGESAKTKHSAGIWGVYVRPEWRGLRIAEGLMDLCLEWAGLRKIQIVKLAVVSTNESAIRLYERSGFIVYGTEPRALYHDGQYYDEHLMFKLMDGL